MQWMLVTLLVVLLVAPQFWFACLQIVTQTGCELLLLGFIRRTGRWTQRQFPVMCQGALLITGRLWCIGSQAGHQGTMNYIVFDYLQDGIIIWDYWQLCNVNMSESCSLFEAVADVFAGSWYGRRCSDWNSVHTHKCADKSNRWSLQEMLVIATFVLICSSILLFASCHVMSCHYGVNWWWLADVIPALPFSYCHQSVALFKFCPCSDNCSTNINHNNPWPTDFERLRITNI